jgi:hypothetical protein
MRSRVFKSAALLPVLVLPLLCASVTQATANAEQNSRAPAVQESGEQRIWSFSIYGDSGLDFVSTGVSASVLLERSRNVMQQFISAYNREDVTGVLNLMNFHYVDPSGERFSYSDCNFRTRVGHIFTTKAQLRAWLQTRFRLHDRFSVSSISQWEGDGTLTRSQLLGEARAVGFAAERTSDDLRAVGLSPLEMGDKFVLDGQAQRLMRNVVGDCNNLPSS